MALGEGSKLLVFTKGGLLYRTLPHNLCTFWLLSERRV